MRHDHKSARAGSGGTEQELPVFQQTMCTARSLVAVREGQHQHRHIGWAFLGSAPPVDTEPSRARTPSLQHTQLSTGTAEPPG